MDLNPDANPFTTSPGRVPAQFGGRGAALADARTILARLAARRNAGDHILEGLRGMGKTALLAHIRDLADAQDLVPIPIECGHTFDMDTSLTLRRALHELTTGGSLRRTAGRVRGVKAGPVEAHLADPDDMNSHNITHLVIDVAAAAEAADRPVLLTVDEAHENPEEACRIIRGVHAAGQAGHPLATYLAGLPGLHQQLAEVTTYAERILVTELDVLDRDGVHQALVDPCLALDVDVHADVVDLVSDRSGGYPYFVQIWGYHLWRASAPFGQIDRRSVDVAATAVHADTSRLHASRWKRVPNRERDYLAALAHTGGHATSADVAHALGVETPGVSRVRGQLLDRGMIYAPSHGTVAIAVPGLADWIVEHRPAD